MVHPPHEAGRKSAPKHQLREQEALSQGEGDENRHRHGAQKEQQIEEERLESEER